MATPPLRHGLMGLLLVVPALAFAQSSSPKTPPAKPQAAASVARPATGPSWKELTAAQRKSLKPLEDSWNDMDEPRKRKWLAISQNYPKLSAAEKEKVQERMSEWTALSAQQRTRARLSFAETKELTAEQKEERWQAYQALSGEEKRALARAASQPPTGAAAAIKPVPAHKLAVAPPVKPAASSAVLALPAKNTGKQVLGSTSVPKVNRNTLLPKPPASAVQVAN
ncbi:MAG: DUF3106 domain-containing protein [Pseudomonadota bacterium]